MADLTAYRDGLLDVDGSCRDVNFTPLTLDDCRLIVSRIFSQSQSGNAADGDGNPLPLDANSFVDAATSTANVCAAIENVSNLFTHLRCFICDDNDGAFLELTFFPDDIATDSDPLVAVIHFLRNICEGTTITEYFVRYENVSWSFGDSSGVIFTRSDVVSVA